MHTCHVNQKCYRYLSYSSQALTTTRNTPVNIGMHLCNPCLGDRHIPSNIHIYTFHWLTMNTYGLFRWAWKLPLPMKLIPMHWMHLYSIHSNVFPEMFNRGRPVTKAANSLLHRFATPLKYRLFWHIEASVSSSLSLCMCVYVFMKSPDVWTSWQ